MAPCRIESVSPDGLTIIASVEYDRPCSCADLYNGERLRLDLTEVWPPVWLLSAQRHEQQNRAAATTAAHQPLGAAPRAVHPWDTGGPWPHRFAQGRESGAAVPALPGGVLRASDLPELPQSSRPQPGKPMKRTARKAAPDAGQQLLFSDRPTLAERIASGELLDLNRTANANGFRWPLAVSAALYRDVETIPRGCAGSEVVSRRWKHVPPARYPRCRSARARPPDRAAYQRGLAHERRAREKP